MKIKILNNNFIFAAMCSVTDESTREKILPVFFYQPVYTKTHRDGETVLVFPTISLI